MFLWWQAGSPQAKKALLAGTLGWMLDSFDVMLYALVLSSIMPDLGMSKEMAGALGSLTARSADARARAAGGSG